MGIFSKKEGVEVLDLPDLQRRGLLKLPTPHLPKDDLIDLTKIQPTVATPINPPFQPPTNNAEMKGVSDFLSDFASIGASVSNSPISPVEIKSSTDNLHWRVENTEYKIEQLLVKIAELEKKIQ